MPSTRPSLNALRTFDVVARQLNFRLAADELGVTQAAVAQHIRGLEASLGVRLFERLARGLALTEAGAGYAASVRTALGIIDQATAALQPSAMQLTLSVTPTFAAKWLLPRLGAFAQAHPSIDLNVQASDRLARFHSDGVGLAVRYGQPPFGPGLNSALLLEERVVAVASPALAAPWNTPTLLHDAHDFWPLFGPARDVVPARHLRFNQSALAIDAALAGQGIALASACFVASDLAAGRLCQVHAEVLLPGKGFYLVWPRSAHPPAALATVMQWLHQQASSFSTG